MREKLIELLWEYDQMRMMRMSIEECVDKLIANGVTIQKWIPVTERLPEDANLVLAIDRDGLMSTAYYVGRWHGMLDEDAITHWMPLPEPPKEETP